MKHFTFYRESNKFDDILSDPTIKKYTSLKLQWYQHLTIGLLYEAGDEISGYIVLKYGDEITKLTDKDYTPIAGVDYIPKRN